MISPCPRCEKNDFKKTRDRDAHLNRKYKCPIKNFTSTLATFRTHAPKVVHNPKIPKQVPQIDPEVGPSIQPNKENTNIIVDDVNQEDVILLSDLGLLDKAKSKKFISEDYIEGGFSTYYQIPSGDIIFEESIVGDQDRPYS
ncbi:27128_t:CDS:1, partial [Gigaspora margarita]